MTERAKPPFPLSELTAVTPLDGRYRSRAEELVPFVSEYALIQTRIEIEAKYLVALSDIGVVRPLDEGERQRLTMLHENISLEDAKNVKKIEDETRHDVKAMERVLRGMFSGSSLVDLTEMIHFGLTSEDVNNLAYRLMLKRATHEVYLPITNLLIDGLCERAQQHKATSMLARTHGQPAVPTTLGKEFAVFALRLHRQTDELKNRSLTGKLTGAVGNFNALYAAYPKVDWISFSEKFVASLGLIPNLTTTQINPYEDVIAYFQNIQRIHGVIIDFDQDMWRYISDGWFVQQVKKGEVGSSTMPQKVNPIDFENSEGNLGIANAILEHFARKLAISRLQRDLSDSTVIRNIGTALGFSLVGCKSTLAGLSRVQPNLEKIEETLNTDWAILAEGVQTLLRKMGIEDPYALIASLTRGEHIGERGWRKWVENLPLKTAQKKRLLLLTPQTYIGLAVELTERAIREIESSRK